MEPPAIVVSRLNSVVSMRLKHIVPVCKADEMKLSQNRGSDKLSR